MKKYWFLTIVGVVVAIGIVLATWSVYRPQASIGDTIYDPFFCDYVGIYGGKDYGFTGTGKDAECFLEGNNNPNLASIDFDNKASSVHVVQGYKVTLYDSINFSGESITLTADTPNLNAVVPNFDNRTSSIKVEKIGAEIQEIPPTNMPETQSNQPTPKVSLTYNDGHETSSISGQTVYLNWKIEDAIVSSCYNEPSGDWWSGSFAGNNTSAIGNVMVSPSVTTTYKLICGDVSSQVVVTVFPADTAVDSESDDITPAETMSEQNTMVKFFQDNLIPILIGVGFLILIIVLLAIRGRKEK